MSGPRDLSGFSKEPPPDRSIDIAPPPPTVPTVEQRPASPVPPVDAVQVDSVETPNETSRTADGEGGSERRKEKVSPSAKAFSDEDAPTERRTFSLPPSDLERARELATKRDMWVSDLIRDGLLRFAGEIGPPPSGRRRRNRKSGNYVPFTVVLEADELAALEKAAGEGRNNSWVVRAVLRRELSADDEIELTDLP